jgi:hypothetical protein
MGMYTQLFFNAELKKDLPDNVVSVLNYMTGKSGGLGLELPDHELFRCSRWEMVLNGTSGYFAPATSKTVFYKDELSGSFYLSSLSSFKNYSGEIDKFLDWIKPFLARWNREVLGWTWYEEAEEPTLIRMGD